MDGPWARSKGCSPAWPTIEDCLEVILPSRAGDEEAYLVWLCGIRQVRSPNSVEHKTNGGRLRTLSMTFGRPAAIPDNYVKLELPLKREFEKSSAFVDDETSSLSVGFFNSTV